MEAERQFATDAWDKWDDESQRMDFLKTFGFVVVFLISICVHPMHLWLNIFVCGFCFFGIIEQLTDRS